jgi:hypothetical protein
MLYALGAEVETFLIMCTGVEDLYIFIHGSLDTILPLLESLPLNRFYTPCDSMSPSPLLSFTRLTGLNLGTELGDEEATSAALAALPKLTHLAFDNEGLLLLAHKILSLSRSPAVLIYFAWLTSPWRNKVSPQLTTDIRFVVMVTDIWWVNEDWLVGVQGDMDNWSRAAIFVAKRRTRELNREFMI